MFAPNDMIDSYDIHNQPASPPRKSKSKPNSESEPGFGEPKSKSMADPESEPVLLSLPGSKTPSPTFTDTLICLESPIPSEPVSDDEVKSVPGTPLTDQETLLQRRKGAPAPTVDQDQLTQMRRNAPTPSPSVRNRIKRHREEDDNDNESAKEPATEATVVRGPFISLTSYDKLEALRKPFMYMGNLYGNCFLSNYRRHDDATALSMDPPSFKVHVISSMRTDHYFVFREYIIAQVIKAIKRSTFVVNASLFRRLLPISDRDVTRFFETTSRSNPLLNSYGRSWAEVDLIIRAWLDGKYNRSSSKEEAVSLIIESDEDAVRIAAMQYLIDEHYLFMAFVADFVDFGDAPTLSNTLSYLN